MDKETASKLNAAIKKLQSQLGETVTINEITYPCVVGMEHLEQELVEGAWKPVSHVAISINLTDILASPDVPAFGQTALMVERGRTYRISEIQPTQTTWELTLIDVTT